MASWREFILGEQTKPYYLEIVKRVQADRKLGEVYPAEADIFAAFKHCPLDKVKVCALGQDPYTSKPGQAMGLAFSVSPTTDIPPSLKNIQKEIQSDLGEAVSFAHGCLIDWAKQGVMLLNASLTVKAGESGSHRDIGWEEFTDGAIKLIAAQDRPIVFLLWGKDAGKKKELLTNSKHLVLEAAHPSFYSCKGFFGCKHFSKTNTFLTDNGSEPIDWSIL